MYLCWCFFLTHLPKHQLYCSCRCIMQYLHDLHLLEISPPWRRHYCRVRRLTWCNDLESYAGGSVATGRATHAGQVKGEHPDKERYPGPPGWGLGVLLGAAPRKKSIAVKVQWGNFGQMQGRRNRLFEMDNEKKIKLATWNIRTM